MFRRSFLFIVALALVAGGCASNAKPPKTQLETRELQTRTFDTKDEKLVMKAMLNVLQDDGYVVKNAVTDLGLITATHESDLAPGRSGGSDLLGGLVILGGGGGGGWGIGTQTSEPRYQKTEQIEFTGNISEFGEQTKVRVSFQRKVLDNRGEVVEVQPIDDGDFYQNFFSRMDKGLFLQNEKL